MINLFPKKAKEIINAPIPEELIKERSGGGKKMLSYISGSTVIDLLNMSFDFLWSHEIVKTWITESLPFLDKWSKNPDSPFAYNAKGEKLRLESQGPVAHALVKLSIPIFNEEGQVIYTITKYGTGSKSILGKQNDQESIFKAAATDGLKKAASLLGIGNELYRDENEQEFYNLLNYKSLWANEDLEKFKNERQYITDVISNYNLSTEQINSMVTSFDPNLKSLTEIVPKNIIDFTSFLKNRIEKSKTE